MNSTTLFLLFPRYAFVVVVALVFRTLLLYGVFSRALFFFFFVCFIFFLFFFSFFFERNFCPHKNFSRVFTTTPFASRRRTTMAEASDRGGFSRGFGRGGDRGDRRGRGGDRGGRGRGGRGRGRGKEDKDVWTPCTKLGRLVQAVRVRNYSLFLSSGGDVRSRNGRVSFESVSRRRDGVCDALSRSRRLRRARFPFLSFFVFRIDFGPREGFFGARYLSRHVAPRTSTRTVCAHQCPFFSSWNSYRVKSNRSSKSTSTPSQSKYQIVDYFVGANLVDEVMKKSCGAKSKPPRVMACDSKRS